MLFRYFQVGVPLLQVQIQYIPQSYNISFTFTGLSDNKTYSLFHFATVDSPLLTALSTQVSALNITTLASTSIDINSALRLALALLAGAFTLVII